MRKSRTETVAENRDAFLAGKSEEQINKFNEKTLDQQYAAIAAWKANAKKLGDSTKEVAKATAATVVSYLKEAHKKLQKLESLSPKEAQKLMNMLETVKGSIDNFERMKKEQYLAYLKAEKEKLQKQGNDLEQQIQNLQNELS